MSSKQIQELEQKRDALKVRLAAIRDMRQGSLVERYRRCGNRLCHCAQEVDGGHGPSWSLTRGVAGKTVTRIIPAHEVERTREQLAEYKKFRELMRELVEINERLCDARLRTEAEAGRSDETAKKRASKRSSRAKSSPRSRP